MSDQNTEEIYIEPDPHQALERPVLPGEYPNNVISFPVRPKSPEEYIMKDQGDTADQANPAGIPRADIDADIAHQEYLKSVESIGKAIEQTNRDTINESTRQARFFSDPRDIKAKRNSEDAFDDVENLRRPAGANATRRIGSTALKINIR